MKVTFKDISIGSHFFADPTTIGKFGYMGEGVDRKPVPQYIKIGTGRPDDLEDNAKFIRGDGSYGDCLWRDYEECFTED